MSMPPPGAAGRAKAPMTADDAVVLELEIGSVAHGGHCVARADGRVVFVRHALPGERVRARLTATGSSDKFWRADAIEILEPSPDRVPSVWPAAGPDGVGGGELAHVRLDAQREWKSQVIAEQFSRLAGLTPDFAVTAAPGDEGRNGLGWRTRISLIADDAGRAGMRKHRSHDVVALDSMPLATTVIGELCAEMGIFTRKWTPGTTIDVTAPASGAEPLILADGVPWRNGRFDRRPNARNSVLQTVTVAGETYEFRIAADGFWQVHRQAPEVLVSAVLDRVGQVSGGTVIDLFSGAGLFTAPLTAAVGAAGRVVSVEGDSRAGKSARRALHGAPQAELHVGDVERVLGNGTHGAAAGADVVVLDPPRAGAGRKVVERIVALAPQRIVYVACDPAALARDVAYFSESESGYELADLSAFDLFPHTHHVECVALLQRK